MATPPQSQRAFSFEATSAVQRSRRQTRWVTCSLCQHDGADYLFYRSGIRYVRCRTCRLVYVNPVAESPTNYFDMVREGRLVTARDRRWAARDLEAFIEAVAASFARSQDRPPRSMVLVGRFLPELAERRTAERFGLKIIQPSDEEFSRLSLDSDIEFLSDALAAGPDLIILNEFLEACVHPRRVVASLRSAAGPATWFCVSYSNTASMPAKFMRRHWPALLQHKTVFFDAENLSAVMAVNGLSVAAQFPFPSHRTLAYVLDRTAPRSQPKRGPTRALFEAVAVPVRAGHQVSLFRPEAASGRAREKLSIILPAYNEERYIAQVIDAVLAKPLGVERELIIVESNSRDGTREIVKRYERHPDVRVLLEDRPRGKGHAVRAGLRLATGSIILIQDADFEYDIDDYDGLLEPILQRRTQFVLGSRSLGRDDWKVRRYARNPVKALAMNLAQLGFAKTFNLLYQQRTTDINTMFKVFRRECLDGIELVGDGFDLDIELVCKLVRAGFAPMEVPVNYVSRGFDEGKKINFWRDAFPSYWAIFENRWSSTRASSAAPPEAR